MIPEKFSLSALLDHRETDEYTREQNIAWQKGNRREDRDIYKPRLGEKRFYYYCYSVLLSKDIKQRFYSPAGTIELDSHHVFIYIGKGQAGRAYSHINLLASGRHPNRLFQAVFDQVGGRVTITTSVDPHGPVKWFTEDDAYAKEAEMVESYGRRDLGTGPLVNLCAGGRGTKDRVLTDEQLEVLRSGRVDYWADPEYRATMTPIFSAASKERWQNPDYRAAVMAGIAKANDRTDARAKAGLIKIPSLSDRKPSTPPTVNREAIQAAWDRGCWDLWLHWTGLRRWGGWRFAGGGHATQSEAYQSWKRATLAMAEV